MQLLLALLLVLCLVLEAAAQDLARTKPAGSPRPRAACAIDLYPQVDFRGARLRVDSAARDLAAEGFSGPVASFRVWSGLWTFYRWADYGGPLGKQFRPGRYESALSAGIADGRVGSLHCIRGLPPRAPRPLPR